MRYKQSQLFLLMIAHTSEADQMTGRNTLLWLALFVGLTTYSFWSYLGNGAFYIGNSLFIFLLCAFLFNKNRSSLVCYLLLCVSLNNLFDELFFNPTEIQYNEIILLILMPFVWYLKTKKYARKNVE